MKFFLPIIYFTFSFFSFFSQENSNSNYKGPNYVGGRKEFYKYLDKYFIFPASEREKGTKGVNLEATIYISKEGKVKFVNVTGESGEFKNQVKRLLTLMPDWNPAIFKGVPIDTMIIQKVWFTMGDSRLKDTTIYECRLYQIPLTDSDISKRQKEKEDNADKRANAKDFYNKASIEFNQSNFLEAVRFYNEAKLNGLESVDLYFNLAVAQLKAGDKLAACPNFKEAARKGDQEAYNLYIKMCK